MKYKRILEEVEAHNYNGNYDELVTWFLKHSKTNTLPFILTGREVLIITENTSQPIIPGSYVILNADRKTVTVKSRDEFLNQYRRVEDEFDDRKEMASAYRQGKKGLGRKK